MAAPRNFAKYALCYDLLYRDKDYAAEAGYVGRLIRSATPAARSVLEFGCGTGRHARLHGGFLGVPACKRAVLTARPPLTRLFTTPD